MSYGEYANSGRSGGRILYQLSLQSIPGRVVERVMFSEDQKSLTLDGEPFATYEWLEGDVPHFTFAPEFQSYQRHQDTYFNKIPDRRSGFETMTFNHGGEHGRAMTIKENGKTVVLEVTTDRIFVVNGKEKSPMPDFKTALRMMSELL